MDDFLPWKSSYSVGVEELDEQHRNFFTLAGRLNDAIKYDVEYGIIKSVLLELLDYAKTHFDTEERYFTSYNFPQGTSHKLEHSEFVNDVLDFSADFRNGKVFKLPENLMRFIQTWIIKHILGTDMIYKGIFTKSMRDFKTLNPEK